MESTFLNADEIQTDGLENNASSSNVDRFYKRLEKYRSHSNDCKFRVDQTSDQIHELQNNEISLLQNKTKEQKKKKSNRKGLTRFSEHSNLIKNQHRLCQSSQLTPTLPDVNVTQCSIKYFHDSLFSHHNPYEQITQVPVINDVPIKQENEQQFYSPENEFDDLDFNGMAKLMNQPVGPELLKFDEDCQQVPSFTLQQYIQYDDQSRCKNIHLNSDYFP